VNVTSYATIMMFVWEKEIKSTDCFVLILCFMPFRLLFVCLFFLFVLLRIFLYLCIFVYFLRTSMLQQYKWPSGPYVGSLNFLDNRTKDRRETTYSSTIHH